MPRKAGKSKKQTRKHRGGGYGFGGSILGSNANSAGAGNVDWKSTGGECGSAGRGGNDTLAGGRRRRRSSRSRRSGKKNKPRRRTMKGGMVALQQPRAGYSFDGSGYAGMANAVSGAPNTTNV
jgi:hypothetical protein